MSDLNRIFLMGRVGNELELKTSQNGKPYLRISLATHGNGTSGESTQWHRIVVFGAQAENCARYLQKGSLIFVEGSSETSTYTDADGKKSTSTSVIAYRIQFMSSYSKKSNEDQNDVPAAESASA
ncbi:MAG TPA: single-stranded DNA-binding protein [Oligoflexia bacterium]|nr:single-stranded DNA-binding protein [Oligoflexia bacterium]